MTKTVVTLACTAVLFLACAEAQAAPQGTPTTPEAKPASPDAKPTSEGEAAKPEGEAAKPEEAAPSAPSAGAETPETEPAEGEPVSLGELTRDGFEIRATEFIPAEAVTRHSGKVSSDAVVVTLQKTSSTAVCFYTLKAYVGKKLTTIPACIVHR
jgi:hypothetical protein